jgi:hypothetical protein
VPRHAGQGDAQERAQPQGLHADGGRLVVAPGAEAMGEALGGAVGDEGARGSEDEQRGCGQRHSAELSGAEVADDGGVDQHVQRLDGQRAQRRQRQAGDVAIETVAEQRHDLVKVVAPAARPWSEKLRDTP